MLQIRKFKWPIQSTFSKAQNTSLNFKDIIYRLIEDMAMKLRDEGSKLNDSIAKEFNSLIRDLSVKTADEKYWLAVVTGGT